MNDSMKILTNKQIRQADKFTIENEPVKSVDLMERAANRLFTWIIERFDRHHSFVVVCGLGNNGGDGLALSRMLHSAGYKVLPVIVRHSNKTSDDFKINEARLLQLDLSLVRNINDHKELSDINPGDIIVDALFGSGLTKSLKGDLSDLVQYINSLPNKKIAIDLPSGMFSDQASNLKPEKVIKADYTLSFQVPKLCFYIAENAEYLGETVLLDIGLSSKFIGDLDPSYVAVTRNDAAGLLRYRNKFAHKGTFGHALIVSGSLGKIGAAVLASRACLRAGAGLLTCHIPTCGYDIMQTAAPEVMVNLDKNDKYITNPDLSVEYDAIGIGPGIGLESYTAEALQYILRSAKVPLVIDADGINLLSANPHLLDEIKPGTIITPHPKEFDRLAGESNNGFERLEKQIELSKERNLYIILKGHRTSISTPAGKCYFNTSGNPGMATAGSGDVLTGIITGLVAQGYNSLESCLLGVYLHGFAGDIAAEKIGEHSMIASDISESISSAYQQLIK